MLLWRGDQIRSHVIALNDARVVSILVVVEGRSDLVDRSGDRSGESAVSILVVVEGRSDHPLSPEEPLDPDVSILVVVEGRSDLRLDAVDNEDGQSFNPCCCGGAIRSRSSAESGPLL